MVQQRHGGLLTGLAGVMLEGLAAGMAPTAREATEMPMRMQQQAMQQQELQMRQQQMQEEMRMQPVRDKLLLASTQMSLMRLDHAMQDMNTQNQLGMSDFQTQLVQKAFQEHTAEKVAEGTVEDVNNYLRQHAHDPDGLQQLPFAVTRDARGNVTRAGVIKIHPQAEGGPIDTSISWTTPDGRTMDIPIKVGAGPIAWQTAVATKAAEDAVGAQAQQENAKTPAEGLTHALTELRKPGGDTPQNRETVKFWEDAIQMVREPQSPEAVDFRNWQIKHPDKGYMDYKAAEAFATESARTAALAGGLSSIDSQVDALHAGVVAPSQLSKRAATFNQIITRFHQKYPDESLEDLESKYKSGQNILKDFTSGQAGRALASINTSYLHLGQLRNVIAALGTGDYQLINRANLEYQRQVGVPAPTNFGAVHQVLSAELARSLTGAAATVEETGAMNEMMAAAQSPKALNGVIDQVTGMLTSKEVILRQQYEKGRKGEPSFGAGPEARGGAGAGGAEAATPMFAQAPGKPRLVSYDNGKTWQTAPQQTAPK
jgi:hypothetical protein